MPFVVWTDGRDEAIQARPRAEGHAPRGAGLEAGRAAVFPAGLGTKVDACTLEQRAQVSGGRVFPLDISVLKSQYARVVEKPGVDRPELTSTNTSREDRGAGMDPDAIAKVW